MSKRCVPFLNGKSLILNSMNRSAAAGRYRRYAMETQMDAIKQWPVRWLMGLLIPAVLIFSGCAAKAPEQKKESPHKQTLESAPPEKSDAEPGAPGNSYYYFLEAQLQKNKGRVDKAIAYMEAAISEDPDALFLKKELVVLHLHKQNYEKALEMVENILAAEPESPDLLIMKASILQTLDPDAEIIPIYERALSIDPERPQVYKILGKLYMDQGKLDQARKVFKKMVDIFPEDYVGHFHLGKIHASQDNFEAAASAFKKTISLAPSLNQPHWELVKLYKAWNMEDEAISVYEDILANDPDNVAAAIELSLAYYTRFRTEAAGEILADLGRRSIDDASVIRTVIQRLVLKERYDEALTVLQGMLSSAPNNPGLHYAAGIVHYNLDEVDEAVAAFEAVPRKSQFYLNAAIHRGIIAYQQKDLDRAIGILQNALDAVDKEGKAEIIPYLSSFYKEKGELEAAETLIQKGIEMAPDDTELHFELGVIYDKKGQTDAAIEQMKKVIEQDPEHADALNYLGYTYADQGIHLEEAEAMIRKALEQKPENGYIIDSLGWVYYQRGDYEKALEYIEKAVQLIGEDPILLEHLGDVYDKLGKPQRALDAYEKALEKNAENAASLEGKIEALKQSGF